MKKILLTSIAASCSLAVFGQGGVLLENGNNNSAHWNLNTSSGPAAPLGATAATSTSAALLWWNGTAFVNVGTVVVITPSNGGGTFSPNGGLYWTSTVVQSAGITYAATGTFEVQGWTGNYASYAAAVAGGAYTGETASFTAAEANEGTTPPGIPVPSVAANGPTVPAGQWNGNLVLTVPEPSTIALGGLGAAALLLFRRKK